jgi:hypothetical protein
MGIMAEVAVLLQPHIQDQDNFGKSQSLMEQDQIQNYFIKYILTKPQVILQNQMCTNEDFEFHSENYADADTFLSIHKSLTAVIPILHTLTFFRQNLNIA